MLASEYYSSVTLQVSIRDWKKRLMIGGKYPIIWDKFRAARKVFFNLGSANL